MTMRSLRLALAVAGAMLTALSLDAGPLVITPTPESEPNNTAATADPLPSLSTVQAASGAISPASDADYLGSDAVLPRKLRRVGLERTQQPLADGSETDDPEPDLTAQGAV